MMVLLKIAAILAFIIVGAHFIHPSNYHPFIPEGWSGVLTGGSIIFFTYIGFDSVSTAAEEARNPQRDLPIGIIATLIVCTVLYIAVAVVLTGIVNWSTLVDDAAPVVNSMKRLTLADRLADAALDAVGRALRSHDGHDFVAAGVSARTGARMVRHVARRAAAPAVQLRASASSARPPRRPGLPASWLAFRAAFSISARWPTCRTSALCSRSCWYRLA